MKRFVGLDVSQKETVVCVVDCEGNKIWQGCCRSTPEAIAAVLRQKAPTALRVAMETGPLAVWLWHGLKSAGIPVICLHARHAHAALSMQLNKTDVNDAYGLAQIVRTGWYREVEVKSIDSHRHRLLLSSRAQLVSMRTRLYNQIRGCLKTFGIILPPGRKGVFERMVASLNNLDQSVRAVVQSLLEVWRTITAQINAMNVAIARAARTNEACRRMMMIPGVGPITAIAFASTVDRPGRFRRAKDLGPYLGLTPRRYQSGDVDRGGRISKCGDRLTRSMLFEAAGVLLFRTKRSSAIQRWGLAIVRRSGYDKARVAVARKLAVVMHRIWTNGTEFCWQAA